MFGTEIGREEPEPGPLQLAPGRVLAQPTPPEMHRPVRFGPGKQPPEFCQQAHAAKDITARAGKQMELRRQAAMGGDGSNCSSPMHQPSANQQNGQSPKAGAGEWGERMAEREGFEPTVGY